jgi:hypothetical protein
MADVATVTVADADSAAPETVVVAVITSLPGQPVAVYVALTIPVLVVTG